MSTIPPPSPELLRLKRQAVKRFHPDNAVDKEDEIRLTRLMQAANAAFDARDEAALRAVFAPPQPPPPQAPPNAWGPRTYQQQTPPKAQQPPPPPPAQPRAQQQQAPSPPSQPQRYPYDFKVWFWTFWIFWSIACFTIVGAVISSSDDATGISLALTGLGLFVSLFVAHYRAKVQRWVRTRRANISRFDQWVIAFSLFIVGIALVAIRTTTSGPDSSAPPVKSITKQAPPANASTEEIAYTNGILREVDRNFTFFVDKEHSNPPKGTAVDMSFQIGPTGYHNAASIIKSSGDSGTRLGLHPSCRQVF